MNAPHATRAQLEALQRQVQPGTVLEVVEYTHQPSSVGERWTVHYADGRDVCCRAGRKPAGFGWPVRVRSLRIFQGKFGWDLGDRDRRPHPRLVGHRVTFRIVVEAAQAA